MANRGEPGRGAGLRSWRRAQLASQWPYLLTAVGLGVALPVSVGVPDLRRPFGAEGHEIDVAIVMMAAIGALFLGLAALTGRRMRELLLALVALGVAAVHPGLDFLFGAVGDDPLSLGRSLSGGAAAVAAATFARPRRGLGTALWMLTAAMGAASILLHGAGLVTTADHFAPASALMLAFACGLGGLLAHVRGVACFDGGLTAVGVLATSAGLGMALQLSAGHDDLTVGVVAMTMTAVILAAVAALMAFLEALERHDLLQDTERLARSLELARLTAETRRHAEIAHDQRTSLLAIEAAANRLCDDPSAGLADAVAHEAARLQRMLGDATPDQVRFAVDEVVAPVVECLSALYGPMPLRVTGAAVAWGRVDETAEIVGALIENAHEHGRAPVTVAVDPADDHVVVRVHDTGNGVPPALREVIFERGVTSDPGRHSGLGLFAARRLARANGGDLRISPRDAATFELTVPASPPAEHHPETETDHADHHDLRTSSG